MQTEWMKKLQEAKLDFAMKAELIAERAISGELPSETLAQLYNAAKQKYFDIISEPSEVSDAP